MYAAERRLVAIDQTARLITSAREPGEGGLVGLERAEHRVTEHRPATLIRRRASLHRSGVIEKGQLLRVRNRQRGQQNPVKDRKHGRVDADTEGERQHGDRRETWIRAQDAQAVAQILPELFDPPRSARLAPRPCTCRRCQTPAAPSAAPRRSRGPRVPTAPLELRCETPARRRGRLRRGDAGRGS